MLAHWIGEKNEGFEDRKKWLEKGFVLHELFGKMESENVVMSMGVAASTLPKMDMQGQKRVARALRSLGFAKISRRERGVVSKVWTPKKPPVVALLGDYSE